MIRIELETNCSATLNLLNSIPEFDGTFTEAYLKERLINDGIILLAFDNNTAIGCKIAYNRFGDKSLYSWLGAVLPNYRKQGIATLLNHEMEKRATINNYTSILFKTRNKHKSMLQFALKNGYDIINFEEKTDVSENRIILKKEL